MSTLLVFFCFRNWQLKRTNWIVNTLSNSISFRVLIFDMKIKSVPSDILDLDIFTAHVRYDIIKLGSFNIFEIIKCISPYLEYKYKIYSFVDFFDGKLAAFYEICSIFLSAHIILIQHVDHDLRGHDFSWNKGFYLADYSFQHRLRFLLYSCYLNLLSFKFYLSYPVTLLNTRIFYLFSPPLLRASQLILVTNKSCQDMLQKKYLFKYKSTVIGSFMWETISLPQSSSANPVPIIFTSGIFRTKSRIQINIALNLLRSILNSTDLSISIIIKCKPGELAFLLKSFATSTNLFITDKTLQVFPDTPLLLPADSTACIEYALIEKPFLIYNSFPNSGPICQFLHSCALPCFRPSRNSCESFLDLYNQHCMNYQNILLIKTRTQEFLGPRLNPYVLNSIFN